LTVVHLHADNEFNVNGLDEVLSPTQIHIYAAKEHVGVIERSIRTVKERCRYISHSMPYTRHPKILTRCMFEFVVATSLQCIKDLLEKSWCCSVAFDGSTYSHTSPQRVQHIRYHFRVDGDVLVVEDFNI